MQSAKCRVKAEKLLVAFSCLVFILHFALSHSALFRLDAAMPSPLTHVTRAFAWNLGKVVPSAAESSALADAGVTDPTARRYAAWRRSLLGVALVATAAAFALAALDLAQGGLGEFTRLGVGLELAWLAAAGALPVACAAGVLSWTRPSRGAGLLAAAWAAAFLLPFVYALLPVSAIYHVGDAAPAPAAVAKPAPAGKAMPADDGDDEGEDDEPTLAAALDPVAAEKLEAMRELAVEFVLSGGGYLLLLPAVLSLIPGAVNGCLRVKALLPAAQLPGWLLVCVAPAFLLFWAVILVIANHAARSPFLVFGVLLWAGAPIWYSWRGRVFVRSQLGAAEAAKIGGVKKLVLITTLLGVGLLLGFVLTAKVAGLKVVGFERAKAVTTRIDELSEDDEVSVEDVQAALAESKSFVYAFDLSVWRAAVDFLAKLLVVTAVFADLVLRATVAAWRNERTLRASAGAADYDATAAAAEGMFA